METAENSNPKDQKKAAKAATILRAKIAKSVRDQEPKKMNLLSRGAIRILSKYALNETVDPEYDPKNINTRVEQATMVRNPNTISDSEDTKTYLRRMHYVSLYIRDYLYSSISSPSDFQLLILNIYKLATYEGGEKVYTGNTPAFSEDEQNLITQSDFFRDVGANISPYDYHFAHADAFLKEFANKELEEPEDGTAPYYPPKAIPQGLENARDAILWISRNTKNNKLSEEGRNNLLDAVSDTYYALIHTLPFKKVNNSWIMCVTNDLLKKTGFDPIPTLEMDYVVMLMDSESFRSYFRGMVKNFGINKDNIEDVANKSDMFLRLLHENNPAAIQMLRT